jgi:ketosteroid isomerase-like protein
MRYLFIVLAITLFSCQSKPDFDPETAKKEIQAILTEQQKAWNNGDIETYMQGYYKSDSLRFASGGHVSYGWQTTLDRYKAGYPDKSTMGKLTFSNIDIKLLSESSALVFGKWELERAEDHPWGLFTLIFRKKPCGWRIVHDHTSSDK